LKGSQSSLKEAPEVSVLLHSDDIHTKEKHELDEKLLSMETERQEMEDFLRNKMEDSILEFYRLAIHYKERYTI